jgi:hypothetical protein
LSDTIAHRHIRNPQHQLVYQPRILRYRLSFLLTQPVQFLRRHIRIYRTSESTIHCFNKLLHRRYLPYGREPPIRRRPFEMCGRVIHFRLLLL